ncbi:MAG: hypothetical protein AAF280_08560 [Pseudomonadota bacterium]
MPRRNRFAWSNQSKEEQLRMAHRASREDLRLMARAFDWSTDHEAVLSWIMANKAMDLASAITVFFNGDPARFNYISKRAVPVEYRGATKLLDNICLRINSGFYRTSNAVRVDNRHRLESWLRFQEVDRAEGRRGRWILDEAIIETAFAPVHPADELQAVEDLRPAEPAHAVIEPGPVTSAIGRRMTDFISDIFQGRKAG